MFLVLPSIIQQTFLMFSCKDLGDGTTEEFLLPDMSQRCYDAEHLQWLLTIALPMLLLWVIGIPLVVLYLLRKNSHKLDDADVMMKYSFLFLGYKQKYYYWYVWCVNVWMRNVWCVNVMMCDDVWCVMWWCVMWWCMMCGVMMCDDVWCVMMCDVWCVCVCLCVFCVRIYVCKCVHCLCVSSFVVRARV